LTRIAHISTAHHRNELRVHLKECNSLSASAYEVFFFVADGLGNQRIANVQVMDVGAVKGRLDRMLICPWRLMFAARKINACIYHFHDPEILPVAFFLKKNSAAVIYDSHEDVPRAILSRTWIPKWIRGFVSFTFESFENFIARKLTIVVGATPLITNRFRKVGCNSITINNFPLSSEIYQNNLNKKRVKRICFLGGISLARGVREIIEALDTLDVILTLAGPFDRPETKKALSKLPGWRRVDYKGNISREAVMEIMSESMIGMICYLPEPNHINAYPNKLFEYMSAGLPVIASDFPLWREIVEGNRCGICVNPTSPQEIARAVNQLISDNEAAANMGENGKRAVLTTYNWNSEEKKLLNLYAEIISNLPTITRN